MWISDATNHMWACMSSACLAAVAVYNVIAACGVVGRNSDLVFACMLNTPMLSKAVAFAAAGYAVIHQT